MKDALRKVAIVLALCGMGAVIPACSIAKCVIYSNRCN